MGHKASQKKLQYCQPQVEYLGRLISHGTVTMTPEQLDGVSKAHKAFLGMTGFSSEWIEDYARKTNPLRELIKDAVTTQLKA